MKLETGLWNTCSNPGEDDGSGHGGSHGGGEKQSDLEQIWGARSVSAWIECGM